MAMNYEAYDEIVKESKAISQAKNKDYGSGNLLKFREKGIVIRMSDKMARLENLIVFNDSASAVKDESIEDTAKDILNYAIYLVMMKRGQIS